MVGQWALEHGYTIYSPGEPYSTGELSVLEKNCKVL